MFLQTLQQWGQQFKPTDKKQNKVRKTPPKENKYIIRLRKLFILFYFICLIISSKTWNIHMQH